MFPSLSKKTEGPKTITFGMKRCGGYFLSSERWRANDFLLSSCLQEEKERGIVCILQYLKVPQDFQEVHSLEIAQLVVWNGEFFWKAKPEMVIVVFFLLGVATQPPSLKPVWKDPTMGIKMFLFLHRIGLIKLLQHMLR